MYEEKTVPYGWDKAVPTYSDDYGAPVGKPTPYTQTVPYGMVGGRVLPTYGDTYGVSMPNIDFTSQQTHVGILIGVAIGAIGMLLYGRYLA